LRPLPISTKPQKESAGFALEFAFVGELVVDGLSPALREPMMMRRPNTLTQLC
jgi:hypothetical protein